MTTKTGILLINLGTPDSPDLADVRKYLSQFLMDPDVIDIPFFARWVLVHGFILKDRPLSSSEQYKKIWSESGSPLLFHSLELTNKLQERLGKNLEVELGMRYGNPSISSAIENLAAKQVTRIIALPLYPQYSLAATLSSRREVDRVMNCLRKPISLEWIPQFYSESSFLDAVSVVSQRHLGNRDFDMALFSFHGLPERQVKKTDPTGTHCLEKDDCCKQMTEANSRCYRAQCYYTAQKLAERMGIPPEKYRVAFQSRLGRTPWIKPYSDEYYRELPKIGVKKLVVFCPSFVADCLETVEEVSLRGQAEFEKHGGKEIFLVPSLNSEQEWVSAVEKLIFTAPRENY